MDENKVNYTTIDEYIALFSPEIQEILETIRTIVKEEAPEAVERISYQMPAFVYHGNLVYFAAFKKHIGFYPTPSGTEVFKEELSHYKGGKGSVQFPLDQPMPYDLIRRIVKFRISENIKEEEEKRAKKK